MSGSATRRSDNLFVGLYRLAHRQQENFLTESFAHVLRHLLREEPACAARVLAWLAGDRVFPGAEAAGALRVRTQLVTDEFGIPDVRIESETVDVIIEVKLDSGITYGQVEAYRRALEAEARPRRALVALLGYRPLTQLPEGTRIRTWGELGSKLSEEVSKSDSEVSQYLVDQLLGLLNHLRLMPLRVRSGISKGLLEHRAWADKNPTLPAVTRTRLRSIRHVRSMAGCQALFDLLMQMEHVLSHADGVDRFRFDSGPHGPWPWIGFNVNDMEFFYFLPLDNPELVTVQRYRDGVDADAFDGSLGELDARSDRIVRWSHAFDLADPDVDYFERGRAEQVRLLGESFETAFRYGRRLASRRSEDQDDGSPIGSAQEAVP